MNDLELCRRLEAAALSVEGGQWAIAVLAAECQAADFPGWPEKIGNHPLVRRSGRTIREWAEVAKLRTLLPVEGAPFGYYRRAVTYLERLPLESIGQMMQAAVDDNATGEQFSGAMSELWEVEIEVPVQGPDRLIVLGDRLPGARMVKVRRA